ncbi:hypothetical protein SAMN05443244_1771 [Terriglobus roseus]|uniref:Uncharacterized protein n=1 Tax=Terriglobus roseus TaxID=392734 RepID=A0A1H4LZU2_9BACT|nr:hypothetical protein SAMN05443244_1771 [Terriglobus roseus]
MSRFKGLVWMLPNPAKERVFSSAVCFPGRRKQSTDLSG